MLAVARKPMTSQEPSLISTSSFGSRWARNHCWPSRSASGPATTTQRASELLEQPGQRPRLRGLRHRQRGRTATNKPDDVRLPKLPPDSRSLNRRNSARLQGWPLSNSMDPVKRPIGRLCHGNEGDTHREPKLIKHHAAVTALFHCAAASVRNFRSVDRETRWR